MAFADIVTGSNFNDLTGGSADLDYVRDGGSPTGTLNGGAAIASGGQFNAALDCKSGGNDSVEFAGSGLVDAVVQTGCVSVWFKPDYSGSPVVNQNIVVFNESGGFNNLFALVHTNSGDLVFSLANSIGTIVSTSGGAWAATSGSWVHISCNFDMTAGAERMFVDGFQLGTTQTDTATRTGTADFLSCFLQEGAPTVSDGSVDELIIYDAVQRTSQFPVPVQELDLTFPLGNPSFETAHTLTESFPLSWTLAGTAVSWDWAFFSASDTSERFENSWGNPWRATVFIPVMLTDAQFDSALVLEDVEDFEELWNGNQGRLTAFAVANLTDANFDSGTPETVEDFEEEWDSNEDRIIVFVPATHLTDAEFDVANDDVEDFEEEWESNEDRLVAFVPATDLDDAVFSAKVGSPEFDNFETSIDLVVLASVGFATPTMIDPTHGIRVSVFGTFVATITIQGRRLGSGTWEDQVTLTEADVPTEIEIVLGFEALRVETEAYTSGLPIALLIWHELP